MMYINSTVNTTAMLPADPVPLWVSIFDHVQLAVAIIGVLINMGTLITLSVNSEDFSHIIRMLLQYQSAVDCLCCLQACLLFTFPPMWATGNINFDTFVCQIWHSQTLYWYNVTVSVWNLVTLAIERYICICHPLKYNTLTRAHFRAIMVGMFVPITVFMIGGTFQVRLREGRCRNEYFWDTPGMSRFLYAYVIAAFLIEYAIPASLLVILYSLIIINFRKRAKKNLGASCPAAVIDKATTELTKTAIVVTLVFLITIGVELWFYMLGFTGVIEYKINSPIQKIFVLCAVLNSVVNPFIYASFMPKYRMSVKKTFLKLCRKGMASHSRSVKKSTSTSVTDT